MNITAEQIAERDAWERKLMDKHCTLADALTMILHIGAPASPYLVSRVEQAFFAYTHGECDDLAAPFGCAETKREKNKMNHETKRQNVKFHVESYVDQGFPILNPSDWPDNESAFTKTADSLKNVSAATAFEIYYDRDIKNRKASR